MELAGNTKIAAILKANPAALDAIASISSHFEKLRNPLLRKLLASRVSINDAARIGGCQVEDFYAKLAPLGFTVTSAAAPVPYSSEPAAARWPVFLRQLPPQHTITLDVRPHIASGQDPFRLIIDAVKKLPAKQALQLVNNFEPTPLLAILKHKGFRYFVDKRNPNLVHTYFWREAAADLQTEITLEPDAAKFDDLLAAYAGNMRRVDVRYLDMPQPMVTILQELSQLADNEALFVQHKRVPQYLLPQLRERGFSISIKEAQAGEVYLLIYKK